MDEHTEIKKTKNKSLLTIMAIFLIAIVVIGGGVYIWQQFQGSGEEIVQINPEELFVFEIKKENLSDFQKDRAFDSFNTAKNIIITAVDEGQPYDSDGIYYQWLQVAMAQKTVGDYGSAANTWIWFTDVYSGNSISPANLGDLYKSFDVNPEKSEKYYLIAIEREKHDFQIFFGLYELYRYVTNNSDKAIEVLKQGIENNPDDGRYVEELSKYLVGLGDTLQAREIIDEFVNRHPDQRQLRKLLE